MTTRVRTVALLIGLDACGLTAPRLCTAQIQLPFVNLGLTNFEDGLALPGWIIQEFPDLYNADELKDANGNTVPGRNRLAANSTITHVAFVSGQRFLGGWLSFELLQPLVETDLHLASGSYAGARGFADLTVTGGVQWAPMKIGSGVFAHRLMMSVGAPTGEYSDDRPISIGNHFWVFDPYYAVTYETGAIEFSARLHYLWNSVNHDPFVGYGVNSVQAGQAFHMNYSASYEVAKNVRVGFNGYWLQQTTDNRITGLRVPGSLERTVGLGAGVQVFVGRNVWLHLNEYSEAGVRNRPQGLSVTFRITKVIPTGRTAG